MPIRLLRNILFLYLFSLIVSYLNTWLFRNWSGAIEFCKTGIFWLVPFVFTVLALMIGLLLATIIRTKERAKFVFYSSMAGCALFCLIGASGNVYKWYHSRYSSYIDANENFLLSTASYPKKQRVAFQMLTDKYQNANDILLTGISTCKYDSIVGKERTQAYDIEFTYLKKNIKGYYRSMCTLVGDQGEFKYFDQLLTESEQRSIDSSKNETLKEGLKSILEDSARLSLDSATKATIRNKLKSERIVLDTLSDF